MSSIAAQETRAQALENLRYELELNLMRAACAPSLFIESESRAEADAIRRRIALIESLED